MNKSMNIFLKNWLLIVMLFSCSFLSAQTGIGTTTPNASAKLDVYSTNKGFLPPRVTLTSATDATTIASPAEGLLVYNLGSVGLQAGYYYWNGANWATIATATSAGNGVTASDMVKIYDGIGNATSINSTGVNFTVATSGKYLFDFSTGATCNNCMVTLNFQVRDGSNSNVVIGSDYQTSYSNNVHAEYNGRIEVNLLAGKSYNVLVTASNGGIYNSDYTRVYMKQVSGNLPVTGQSVDYIQASLSANQALSAAGNINFNTSFGTGITITSGGFNLIANKTYKLEAALGGTSGGYAYYGWVDNSNNLLPGGSIGAVIKAGNTHTDAPQDKAVVYFTPTIDTRVFLRVYNLSGTLTAYAPSLSTNFSSTWASIQQVGSSAFVNPWILKGNDVYNNTGKVGIGTTTPASTLDVNGSVNASTINLTNATIGTPSLVLKNGDAAAAYSDVAQIKMGWSGSAAGKSQYAQFLHSRHNSGAGGNAIDFYLSDGTADNTITSGSTKAMSIESPGNLTVAGKINLADPTGNVAVKAAGFVNAGVVLTLGDIQVQMIQNGNLQIKTTGNGFTGVASAHASYAYSYYTYYSERSFSVNGTFRYIGDVAWGFATDGDLAVYYIKDIANARFWRITLMVGPTGGATNNFISIERLL